MPDVDQTEIDTDDATSTTGTTGTAAVATRPGVLRLDRPEGAAIPRALLVLPSSHDGPRDPGAVAAGPLPSLLARGGLVVAVDGGVADLRALGCVPDVLVGDLDSASADDVAWAERAGADVQRHPTDKDRTDLALALRLARTQGAEVVDVVGGDDGRLDHLLGSVLALTATAAEDLTLFARLGTAHLAVLHRDDETVLVDGPDGRPFSLLAPRGARGVTVTGARWPLDAAQLEPGATLGVSNEVRGVAHVSCGQGPLLVVTG